MFKLKVDKLLQSIYERKNNKYKDIACKYCGEKGHYSKAYPACTYFSSSSSAPKIGSKRKNMSEAEKANEKQIKKVAKKAMKKNDSAPDSSVKRLTSCHMEGHSSARSPLCPNKKVSKEDQVKAIIGEYTSVTRKIKLETILLPKHRDVTVTFIEVSEQIRNIVVPSQIFVNH